MTVLLIVAGIIALILILALLMSKEHYVRREIIINTPRQKVFDFLKFLQNQEKFNEHAMVAPDRKKEFRGTDGTVGFVYAWSGDKNAGEGEKEIMNMVEGKKIEMEIRFKKPMTVSATVVMEMESLPDNKTRVYWSNAGTLKFPLNVMIPMMQKSVAKGMDASLANLKNILEK